MSNQGEQQVPQITLRLLPEKKKIYDKEGHELSVHYRINKIKKELEIITNRSCEKCINFKKAPGDIYICTRCHYEKDWLLKGKV